MEISTKGQKWSNIVLKLQKLHKKLINPNRYTMTEQMVAPRLLPKWNVCVGNMIKHTVSSTPGGRWEETLLRSTAGRLAAASANINQAEWRLSVEIAMIINYFVSLIVIREVSNLFTMNQTDGIAAEQHPAAPEHCRDDFTHLEINLSFKARMILNISLQTARLRPVPGVIQHPPAAVETIHHSQDTILTLDNHNWW